MKKQLMIICTSILLATTTACGTGSSEGTANKEKPQSEGGKTVVTLSLKETNEIYQLLEKKFEKKYPDIDLQIQSFKKKGEEWGAGDFGNYVNTTNTALLAGKGADIIEVGDLPVDKYINKKLLVNMNDLLEQDKTINKNDLHMNILEALKSNGGLYTMPLSFYLRAFAGDEDILKKAGVNVDDKNWNWTQFLEISKKLITKAQESSKDPYYALADDSGEVLLQEWVMDSYADLVDRETRTAKFDSPLFEEMMLQIKQMYDDKILTSTPSDSGKQLFSTIRLYSPADFINPYGLFANPILLQKPHGEGQKGGPVILTSGDLAIHATSTVKEEAWKFISFMLSEEVQSLPEIKEFSLLKSINEKKLNDMQEQLKNGKFKIPGGKKVKLQIPDEDFAEFKNLINTAERSSAVDIKVISIMGEESGAFFSGQKSAKEVAKLIQDRTTLYLNE